MLAGIDDTIAAVATARGSGLRGVIRVSGPDARSVVDGLFEPDDPGAWENARVPFRHTGQLRIADLTVSVPAAVLWWPTARSYTGQPMAEVHMVGSPPLLDAAVAALCAQGARPAEAGEFTMRAFLGGKLDLLQAEAVLGVIDAPDDAHLRSALTQLAGGVSQRFTDLQELLLIHLADLEAGLDFVDEDIEFVDRSEMVARLVEVEGFLSAVRDQADTRMLSPSGRRVVIAGRANAGKSTLFNALVGSEAAIVSDLAGTTRDTVSACVRWDGIDVELIDTAGIVEPANQGLQQQIDAARRRAWDAADLVIWCHAADHDRDHAEKPVGDSRPEVLHVLTKCDLLTEGELSSDGAWLSVCALRGSGLVELRHVVCNRLSRAADQRFELLGSTGARCRGSLMCALSAVGNARRLAVGGASDELLAIELRDALHHLGQIAGRVYTDDLLDRIFSRFCIGK